MVLDKTITWLLLRAGNRYETPYLVENRIKTIVSMLSENVKKAMLGDQNTPEADWVRGAIFDDVLEDVDSVPIMMGDIDINKLNEKLLKVLEDEQMIKEYHEKYVRGS